MIALTWTAISPANAKGNLQRGDDSETRALVGGCILVVALVIAGLMIFIRLLVRSTRNNRPDVL